MTRPSFRPIGTFLVVLVLAGCGSSESAPADDPATTAGEEAADAAIASSAASAVMARDLGVENSSEPLPGLITSAQPDPDQLGSLADAGVGTAISLRPEGETGAGWEEAFAEGRTLAFHRVAVAGPDDLNRETVEELDRLLAEAGDGPTLLYCASSNRVGALLALRAYWLQDVPAAAALELGREAGLRGLEPAVAEIMGIAGG